MRIDDEFRATGLSVFISSYNYPHLKGGIITPPFTTSNPEIWDNPRVWSRTMSLSQVQRRKGYLISSLKSMNNKLLDNLQDVALSKRYIDMDIVIRGKPKSINDERFGMSAKLERVEFCTNPKMDKVVEKCYYDTDLKGEDAVRLLYTKGKDVHQIVKLFSVGAVGTKKNRKIVPTKWSITAVDDIVGKALIEKVKNYPLIDKEIILSGELYGNHYTILLLPEVWGFELFETRDMVNFAHDFEEYGGRKRYASNTEGGYYAARLGVLEYLNKIKRQARAIVLRRIDSIYQSLGVWVVREATRRISEANTKLDKRILKRSILYDRFKNQRKLFFYNE